MSETGISYEYSAPTHEDSHAHLYPSVSKLMGELPAGAKVLDLGCGNGTFLSLFRERAKANGWQLYGSDFSPTGIEVARRSFPGIEFFLADASAPTSEILERIGQVDLVLSTEVIEHLYNPRGFLRNVAALLRPGGKVILTTPYHGYLKNLLLALTGKLDKHFTVLWDHGHIKFWSKRTLRAVLLETGFEQVRFAGSGRLPWLWKSIVVSARIGISTTN